MKVTGIQSAFTPSKEWLGMKRMTKVLATAALLMCVATAADAAPKKEVFESGKPLAEQITRIEIELNDGETYSELALPERSRVREALTRMRAVVEQYPEQKALPESARMALFNDQQVVNTVLTQAREDSRLICKREKAIGSNFPVTQCMTVAQRERIKAQAQGRMDKTQRVGNYSY
ncbi:hypothetical protein G9274_002965 [Stenotrophomonas rhizophila]|nr:hypothetical protein G9274_002965 [Stenotrophomonas rhizophila]